MCVGETKEGHDECGLDKGRKGCVWVRQRKEMMSVAETKVGQDECG